MPIVLLIAFIVVPVVELALIIALGRNVGVAWTIAILLVDSALGALLVRREGRRTWDAFRLALADHRWPGDEVAQGALVLIGGALLLTPGFLTDVVGLALVIPATRRLVAATLRRRLTPLPLGGGGTPERARGARRSPLRVEVVRVEPGQGTGEQAPPASQGPAPGGSTRSRN